MSFSDNQFAALARPSSHAKGREAKRPATGDKEDQNMQDTVQAGSSISTGDLQQTLPNVNIDEGVALFKRRRAQMKAEDAAKERAKKLRQGNGSALVIPRTVPSSVPSQNRRKRTASVAEDEPSKRQRMGSLSPIQTVHEPAVTVDATASKGETEETEVVRAETPTSAIVVQEEPFLPAPSSFECPEDPCCASSKPTTPRE